MCGRFTSTSSLHELVEVFDVDEVRTDELGARYNVAPTQPVYAIAERAGTAASAPRRLLGTFRWGLVPPWAPDPSVGSRMINARAETVDSKPAFRQAFDRRRCLLPADSFYEWQVGGGSPTKTPFAIARKDGAPMAFAGLWELWRDPSSPDAAPLRSCAIVTTAAAGGLAAIHPRMPVILDAGDWDAWLDPRPADPSVLAGMLRDRRDVGLQWWPVRPLVNAVTNDGPELLVPDEEVAPAALSLFGGDGGR